MENQEDKLTKSLEQYEEQLTQIRQAMNSTQNGAVKQNLYALEKDITELISLTKETLGSVKQTSCEDSSLSSGTTQIDDEYALFKAELAELEEDSDVGDAQIHDIETPKSPACSSIPQELQEDLYALKGSKCQAPYKQQWSVESFYNGLIMDIETNDSITDINHIQVRVMFVNPMEKDMLPCPYYLDGACKFSDDKCHYSHGHLVPLSDIREYREPDFSLVKEGSQVLAKQKDSLWHRAKVKSVLNNNKCLVKFESKGCDMVELDLHDLLPLDSSEDKNEDDYSTTESSSDEDDVIPQDYFVQLSLLKTPPNQALGAWEKHTKGIGSRLMANMGYVVGCGLGKFGEGRLEPVEAMAYPPGKSLDACMALREAAGGDKNMFKAEHRQKKQQRQLLKLQQNQQIKESKKKDVFSFINSQLAGSVSTKSDSSPQTTLASSSRKGLNVERFRVGENIKQTEKDIQKFKQSLQRHEKGSMAHNVINNKLKEAQTELGKLQNSDSIIAKEQNQRDGRKKLAIF